MDRYEQRITINERTEPRRDVTLMNFVYAPAWSLAISAGMSGVSIVALLAYPTFNLPWGLFWSFVLIVGVISGITTASRLRHFDDTGPAVYTEMRETIQPTEQVRTIPTNKQRDMFFFTEGKDGFTARQLNKMRDEAVATGKLTRNDAQRVFSGTEYQQRRKFLKDTEMIDNQNLWTHPGYLWLRLFPTPRTGDENEPSPRDDDGDDG